MSTRRGSKRGHRTQRRATIEDLGTQRVTLFHLLCGWASLIRRSAVLASETNNKQRSLPFRLSTTHLVVWTINAKVILCRRAWSSDEPADHLQLGQVLPQRGGHGSATGQPTRLLVHCQVCTSCMLKATTSQKQSSTVEQFPSHTCKICGCRAHASRPTPQMAEPARTPRGEQRCTSAELCRTALGPRRGTLLKGCSALHEA